MEQVYSLHYTYMDWLLTFWPVLIIILIRSDKFTRGFIKEENIEQYKRSVKFACIGLALTAAFILIIQLEMFVNIYVKYKMGGYEQIEGAIEGFVPSGGIDKFYVKGIYFFYDYKQATPGYRTTLSNGGVFKENGQYVRIQYVEYGSQNVITAIWVEKTDENDDSEIDSDSSP